MMPLNGPIRVVLFYISGWVLDTGDNARFGRYIPTTIPQMHRGREGEWDNVCLQPSEWSPKLCRFQSLDQYCQEKMELPRVT